MFPNLAKLLEGAYFLEMFWMSGRFMAQVVLDDTRSPRDVVLRVENEQMDLALVTLNNEAARILENQ